MNTGFTESDALAPERSLEADLHEGLRRCVELRCTGCGYGAVASAPPLRCPMCGGDVGNFRLESCFPPLLGNEAPC
jgi:rubrerythrin